MKPYTVQKAHQALEELGSYHDLKTRVWNAWGHLGFVDSPDFIEDADEVRKAFEEAREIFKDQSEDFKILAVQSEAIQTLILRIFTEEGYMKAVKEHIDD